MSNVEKSFTTIGLQPERLSNVVACLTLAEKKAKSSGEIQTLEVSRPGFRQDLYLGRIMVVPAAIMDDPERIPHPLLHGAMLQLFDGEADANLEMHRLATTEFDQLDSKAFEVYKDQVFKGADGKLGCIVMFLPAWGGNRDFQAFRFIPDNEKLTLLVRHLIFGAYYRPSLSSLFQTLTEDSAKLDAVNVEHASLAYGQQFQNPANVFPVFEKTGSAFKVTAAEGSSVYDVDDVTRAYLECALWVGTTEDDTPMDTVYQVEDFAPDAVHKAVADCTAFCSMAEGHTQDLQDSTLGHLFWLNRNGHGTGFWDQDDLDDENQQFLDKLSHQFGECDAYVGDDDKIYLTGGTIPAPLTPSPFKTSRKLRVTASNQQAIQAALVSKAEQSALAELGSQFLSKMGNKGDAGSVRIPTSDESGERCLDGAPEIEHIAAGEPGLRQQPDYGEADSYTSKANSGKLASALFSKLADDAVHNGWTEMGTLFRSDFAPDTRGSESDHSKKASQGVGRLACPMCKGDAQPLWKHENRHYARCSSCGCFSLNATKTAFRKEALSYMHPGQALEQFYPEILDQISMYNGGYSEMSYNPPPLQQREGTPVADSDQVTLIQNDFSDKGMPHAVGAPGLIPTQDLESVPLRPNERAIRGPYYQDQFYKNYANIPPALLTLQSSLKAKTASSSGINKVEEVSKFLKGIASELASSLLAAFKVTDKPMFTYTPAFGELDLNMYLSANYPYTAPCTMDSPFAKQVKALVQSLNSGDLAEALNDAWAQAAVWHESDQDHFTYEVFVRLEDFDTNTLKIRYKYLSGRKED